MKDLVSVEGVVKTTYDPSHRVIQVSWTTFFGHDHLRPSIEAQTRCVRDEGARFVIVDVSEAKGVPSDADQTWLVESVFPQYQHYGLQALVTVLPKSAVAKLGSQRWKHSASGFVFQLAEVASIAYAFVAGQKVA